MAGAASAEKRDLAGGAPIYAVVRPSAALKLLLAVITVLVVVSASLRLVQVSTDATPFAGFDRLVVLFDVDHESNVPTWFSTCLLFTAALLITGVMRDASDAGGRWVRHWLVLAAAFAYLSVDEAISLHELAIPLMRPLLGGAGVFTFGWVVIAAPLVLAFGLSYLGFLRALPRSTSSRMVAAGGLYVGGALGVELLGGLVISSVGGASVPYVLVTTVEELMEMCGVALLVVALLHHQQTHLSRTV